MESGIGFSLWLALNQAQRTTAGPFRVLIQINCFWRARETNGPLFDYLVGAILHRLRYGDAKRLRGLEVDHKLDFHRLLHRQIGGLLPLENPAGIDADLTDRLRKASAVAHEATGRGELTKLGDRRHAMARRQCPEYVSATDKGCVGSDHERANAKPCEVCKNRIEVIFGAGLHDVQVETQCASCRLQISRHRLRNFGTG